MKVAIPLFGQRVAPRFECASAFLVAEIDSGGVVARQTYPLLHPSLPVRLRLLHSLGVEAVICGGISGFVARQFQAAGIRLFANVMGDAESALDLFVRGNLQQGWRQAGRARRFRRRAFRDWHGPPFGEMK